MSVKKERKKGKNDGYSEKLEIGSNRYKKRKEKKPRGGGKKGPLQ